MRWIATWHCSACAALPRSRWTWSAGSVPNRHSAATLPDRRAAKFEHVLNLKTALTIRISERLLRCMSPLLAQSGHPNMPALCPLSVARRTLARASDRHPIAIYEYTLARVSQLGGDLEAIGPRLTRREVVVAIRGGPIALVEDVLDIELRLPGLGDLREDAGVEAQEARQVDAVVGRRVRIREVDGAERGRPDRIDLNLVPP